MAQGKQHREGSKRLIQEFEVPRSNFWGNNRAWISFNPSLWTTLYVFEAAEHVIQSRLLRPYSFKSVSMGGPACSTASVRVACRYGVTVCLCSSIVKKEGINESFAHARTSLIVTVNWSPTLVLYQQMQSLQHFWSQKGSMCFWWTPWRAFVIPSHLPVFLLCACLPFRKQMHKVQLGLWQWAKSVPSPDANWSYGLSCSPPQQSPSLWLKRIVLQFLCSGELSCPPAFLDQNFVFDLQQKLDRLINISKQIGFSPPPPISYLELFQEQKLLQLLHHLMLIKVSHLCIAGCRAGNRRRLFLPIFVWSSLYHTVIKRLSPSLPLATV